MKKIILCLLVILTAVLFVGCKNNENEEDKPKELTAEEKALASAKAFVHSMYKDTDGSAITGNFDRIATIKVGDDTFSIDWVVEVTSGDATKIVKKLANDFTKYDFIVDIQTSEQIDFKLKAVISSPTGDSTEHVFSYYIPEFKVLSYAEFTKKAKGALVAVEGVVTAVIDGKTKCLYLEEAAGGYYAYGVTNDISAIKAGMTVQIVGTKDEYSGTIEITKCSAEIVDSTIKTVTPRDYTEAFRTAKDLKDSKLVGLQSVLVTIQGVTVTDEDLSSGYFKFKLGELESYVRISSSVCPLSAEDQATFKAQHLANKDNTAIVTGVVCVYNGAFYLTPVTVNAFSYSS